jgi:hypothetical protein
MKFIKSAEIVVVDDDDDDAGASFQIYIFFYSLIFFL